MLEETGITADPGPEIARMTPKFVTVEGEPVQADERFFLVRVDEARVDTAGHTALERALMTRHRWFTLAELESWHEAVFPANLADMIRSLIAT